MRKVLLIMVILTLVASTAFAQGRVAIFGDPTGFNCVATDLNPPLTLTFYVFHLIAAGATAVEYKATLPACYQGSWVADSFHFTINPGNTQTGVSHAFGSCLNGNVAVADILTFSSGTTPPCCIYPITAGPSGLRFTDCTEPFPVKINLPGQSGIINEVDPGCTCADITATSNSTWGGIKAMWGTESP